MSVLLLKVLWYPQPSNVAVNITDLVDLSVGRGLDIRNNIFSFTAKNNSYSLDAEGVLLHTHVTVDTFDVIFQEDDVVKVYLKYTDDMADVEDSVWAKDNNTEPSSNDLKGVYFITDRGFSQTTSINPIKITCVDKTFILFNRLLAKSFPLVATSGTTTSTTANKLVDSGGSFLSEANVGMLVKNTTDVTEARVTAIDSDTTLSISADIMASGEAYQLQWTAPSILQKAVRFSSENAIGEFTGTGSDSGVKYDVDALMETDEGGFIQDVRKNTYEDGSSNTNLLFPGKSMTKIWKAVYEWTDELSQIEFLNSRNELDGTGGETLVYGRKFLLWVDENNKVHWKETNNTVSETIVIGTTKNIFDYNLTRSNFDVINFVVFRGGEDLYGNGSLDYVIDTSVNSNIKKMHVVAMTDIATKLIEQELAKGNIILNTSGSFTFSGNRYNRNGNVTAVWNDVTYTTDSTYNTALRDEVNRLGGNRARAIVSGRNTSRYKGKIERKGSLENPGDLLNITNKNTGQNNINIRIQEVRDQVNVTGWFTTLQLEQDDEALISLS